FFKADHAGLSAEMARQVLGQIGVQSLVHGCQNALHQQARNQVFGANFQLLRQVFYADAFRDRDGASDGKGLVRQRQSWRRNKAFHRPFFFPRDIMLTRTASRRAGASRRSTGTRRRHTRAYAAHSWTRRKSSARRAGGVGTSPWLTRSGKR